MSPDKLPECFRIIPVRIRWLVWSVFPELLGVRNDRFVNLRRTRRAVSMPVTMVTGFLGTLQFYKCMGVKEREGVRPIVHVEAEALLRQRHRHLRPRSSIGWLYLVRHFHLA